MALKPCFHVLAQIEDARTNLQERRASTGAAVFLQRANGDPDQFSGLAPAQIGAQDTGRGRWRAYGYSDLGRKRHGCARFGFGDVGHENFPVDAACFRSEAGPVRGG